MNDIKPIKTARDHEAALAEIEALFDAEPGTPEADRLEVLTVLAGAWEARHYPLDEFDPLDALTFAMKAQGRTQSDFAGVLKSRSRASEVLNRRRALSSDMINAISRAWSIPVAALGGRTQANVNGLSRLALRGAVAVVLFVSSVCAVGGGALWYVARGLPDIRHVVAVEDQPGFVSLTDIPPHVIKAFLAAEDKDFYDHGGSSAIGISRAAAISIGGLIGGHAMAGGTGISEQVVKNLLLSSEPHTLTRRVKEAILAGRLESAMSKDRILEIYLNEVYLGSGTHGVAQASQRYFGKPLADVTVAEAAVMAGLPKAPNTYRPNLPDAYDQAKAKARRDWVLDRMASDGLITVSAARMAQAESLLRE